MSAVYKHGEYKTAGGKLATVDVAIADGQITNARFRGDFFIHPEAETAAIIERLSQAIEGLPDTTTHATLAAHLASAIPFHIELLGTDAAALAMAVRRAVTDGNEEHEEHKEPRVGRLSDADIDAITEPWRELPWRLLPEIALPPAMNVALDEVLTRRATTGETPPTLRFWRWSDPAVIIGRSQSLMNEVDPVAAKQMGITIVRRITGGGAMFLQPHGAITYSLYLPESAVAGLSIRSSYEVCEAWLIEGLRSLGVDAHHVPINDIACREGKIGGAAQARRGGIVLHHTTLAYDMDPGEMVRVLRIGREKLKDKGTTSAAKRVSPLVRQTGLSREAIVQALFGTFQNKFGGTLSTLTNEELAEAEQLVATKYSTAAWTGEFE